MANTVPRAIIAPSYTISRILKGGWQLAGGHGPIDKQLAIEDMFSFVKAGITTLDFGDIYTGVEELVGQFIQLYKKKYNDPSNNLQLHTKFVPDRNDLPTITKQHVENGIDRSLKRLGVEQLDLVQFHWWDYDVPKYVETASYLADLQKKGKIKHLGVTNFDVRRLRELINNGIPIVSTQNQYSLLDHRPEHNLILFCEEHHIQLLCYGTVAGGFLSEKYLHAAEPQARLENRSLTKYKLMIEEFGGWELFQELLEKLSFIAQEHQVSITAVAQKYILDKPQVAGIIVGARNTTHLHKQHEPFSLSLTQKNLMSIGDVLKKAHGPKSDVYGLERIKNGRHAKVMQYNLNNVLE